jgi:hypothetical protein
MGVTSHKRQAVDRALSNWVKYALDPPFFRRLFGHQIWFQAAAAFWGASVFGLGWLFAHQISFSEGYLGTRVIYVVCLNIAWVLGSVFWGLRQLPDLIDGLQNCFMNVDYAKFASTWKAHFFSNGWMRLCAGLVFALGAAALLFRLNPQATLHIFPQFWYQGNTHPKFALLLTIGFCASLAAGAGISLFVVNLPFVFALLKLPVISLPNVLLAKLRPMSDFYVAGTLAWFVAVGLTALIFFHNIKDPMAGGFLVVTSGIGLSAFIVPQIVFHIMVVRSLSQIADYSFEEFHLWYNRQDRTEGSSKLKDMNDSVKANSLWVFDRGDVASLLTPELITVVGLILKPRIVAAFLTFLNAL